MSQIKSSILRYALQGNSLITGGIAILLMFGPKTVSIFLGITDFPILILLGLGLLVFSAAGFFVASQEIIPHKLSIAVTILHFLEALGCALILVMGRLPLTLHGQGTIALLAFIITILASLQVHGIKH